MMDGVEYLYIRAISINRPDGRRTDGLISRALALDTMPYEKDSRTDILIYNN